MCIFWGKEYNSVYYRSEEESVGEEVGSGHGQIMAMGLVGKIKNTGKSLESSQQGSNMIYLMSEENCPG